METQCGLYHLHAADSSETPPHIPAATAAVAKRCSDKAGFVNVRKNIIRVNKVQRRAGAERNDVWEKERRRWWRGG